MVHRKTRPAATCVSAFLGAMLLTACGVSTGTPSVDELTPGTPKTVSLPVTEGLNAVTSVEITPTYQGAPPTIAPAPPVAGSNSYTAALPGSENLASGSPVDLTWRVNYKFGFLSAQTTSRQQNFTVGSTITMDPSVCVRQGDLAPVALDLVGSGPPENVSLTVSPASLATPQPASVAVSSAGNSINLLGVQLGTGTLSASTGSGVTASANVLVIPALATPELSTPANGASGVFWGNEPTSGVSTVSALLTWTAVAGANEGSQKYRIHYGEAGSALTFTNSQIEEVAVAFPPGTVVEWKVQAQFDNCPSGTTFGPESELRSFTMFDPDAN